MPSLTQLLAEHGRLLVLDAASLKVQVGLLSDPGRANWHTTTDEAGIGIFAGTEIVLKNAGVGLQDAGAFIFCEGPGSMLGTRTVAMALRIWRVLYSRPIYAYQSLAVAGYFEMGRRPARDFTVITDARRDTWHCQQVAANGQMPPLQRRSAGELPEGELLTPANFRAWAQPPRLAASCCYDLPEIFPAIAQGDFFRAVEAPDAFQHEPPAYKKWAAQIHSAATVTRG